jgi:hypothetical protein
VSARARCARCGHVGSLTGEVPGSCRRRIAGFSFSRFGTSGRARPTAGAGFLLCVERDGAATRRPVSFTPGENELLDGEVLEHHLGGDRVGEYPADPRHGEQEWDAIFEALAIRADGKIGAVGLAPTRDPLATCLYGESPRTARPSGPRPLPRRAPSSTQPLRAAR